MSLDDRTAKAQIAKDQAAIARDQVTLDQANRNLARAQALVKSGAYNTQQGEDAQRPDPHVEARQMVTKLDGTPMQGLVAHLSRTPGRLRWAGRPLGSDTDAVLDDLDPHDDRQART